MTNVVIHQKRAPADFKSARQKRFERRQARREERAQHPMIRRVFRPSSSESRAIIAMVETHSPSPTEADIDAAVREFLEPKEQKRIAEDFLEKLSQPSLLVQSLPHLFRRTPPK